MRLSVSTNIWHYSKEVKSVIFVVVVAGFFVNYFPEDKVYIYTAVYKALSC